MPKSHGTFSCLAYDPAGGPSLIGVAGGLFHILFAALLYTQTRRVRCVFEKDSFEFYNIKGPKLDLDNGAWLQTKPDNYVVGTLNRWKYDTITNYGFFPSLEYPVICFFKETETDESKWNRWFAAFDGYGRGQPHFFPGSSPQCLVVTSNSLSIIRLTLGHLRRHLQCSSIQGADGASWCQEKAYSNAERAAQEVNLGSRGDAQVTDKPALCARRLTTRPEKQALTL